MIEVKYKITNSVFALHIEKIEYFSILVGKMAMIQL